MANELHTIHTTAKTVYARIRQTSTNKVWQTTTSTFVVWADGDVANYDVALTETSVTYYSANFPAAISSGSYFVGYYEQAGGTPAIADTVIDSAAVSWGATIGANTMTIAEARALLIVGARNAGTSGTYSTTVQDQALISAFRDFIEHTGCSKRTDYVLTVSGSEVVDFSGLTGFHPDRVIEAWIADEVASVLFASTSDVINEQIKGARGGPPEMIAINDLANLADTIAYPEPDAVYTIGVKWTPPLIAWTAGSTSDTTVINVPAHLADTVVRTAAVCYLQSNQPQQQTTGVIARLWAQYERFRTSCAGSNSFGDKFSTREMGA